MFWWGTNLSPGGQILSPGRNLSPGGQICPPWQNFVPDPPSDSAKPHQGSKLFLFVFRMDLVSKNFWVYDWSITFRKFQLGTNLFPGGEFCPLIFQWFRGAISTSEIVPFYLPNGFVVRKLWTWDQFCPPDFWSKISLSGHQIAFLKQVWSKR